MANIDPFNSVGGYTVGIPPVPFIDTNGNLTVPRANIGNVQVSGDSVFVGNVQANLFIGSFSGNIVGNVVVPGQNTQVLYNDNGNAGASSGFTFDSTAQLVTVHGDLVANTITLGSGDNEFSTQSVLFATTASSASAQILYSIPVTSICSIDFTIIATDATAQARQTSKLFAAVYGTDVGFYEYGTIDVPQSSSGVGDFSVAYDGTSSVNLLVTPATSNLINYKIMITSYKE